MNNVYDQFDPATTAVNPYDQFDAAQPTPQKSLVDRLFDVAKTPSPQWMQPAEEFLKTPLVSPETIAPFLQADQGLPNLQALREGKVETQTEPPLIASPVGQGIVQGVGEAASQFTAPAMLATAPFISAEGLAGKAVAGAFTLQGLSQYPALYRQYLTTTDPKEKARILATAAVLAAPAAGLLPGGRAVRTEPSTTPVEASGIAEEASLVPETVGPQPNVPEGYARFQPPSEITTIQPELPQIQLEQDLIKQAQSQDRLSNQVAVVGEEIPVLSQPEPTQAMAEMQGERIVETAYKYAGKIYPGGSIHKGFPEGIEEVPGASTPEYGFLTNTGRFVDREEAAQISNVATQTLTHDQIKPEPTQTLAGTQDYKNAEDYFYTNDSISNPFAQLRDSQDLLQRELKLNGEGPVADAIRLSINKLTEVADKDVAQYKQEKEGETNASQITSATGLPSGEVRPSMAQETSLRQSGETAPTREQVGQEQVQQEGAVEVPETPRTTGIAQRIHEQRGLGIEPGQGISAKAAVEQGRTAVGEADAVAARIKATGQVSAGDLGILRAKQEQFAKVTNAAEDALRVKPNDPALGQQYEQAFQQERDYAQNVVKPAQTIWHKLGMEQQGAVDIDTGSFTGLRRAVEELHKEPVRPEQAPRLEAAVQKVKAATAAETRALQKLANATERGRRTKARSIEELRDHFAERMKQITPC